MYRTLIKTNVMVLLRILVFVVLENIVVELVLSAPYTSKLSNSSARYFFDDHDTWENLSTAALLRLLTKSNITHEAQTLLSAADAIHESYLNSHQIIFPDVYEKLSKPIIRIQGTPDCSDGTRLCEKINHYPYTRLKAVLQRTDSLKEYFGVDEAPPEIADRIGGFQEDYLCGSVEVTMFPQAGMNKNNKWKYIVNQDDGYIQGIRVEKCLNLNSPCNLMADAPLGYVTTCKQKYILRRLLSVTDNGQPEPDSFYIPSACCCSFKKDANFLIDFGKSNTPALPPTR